MSKTTYLRDAYCQPGFVPASRVQTVRNNPDTFVVSLRRRRKKTSAGVAVAELYSLNSSFVALIALGAA